MAERIPAWDETEEIPSWEDTEEIPSWEDTEEIAPVPTLPGREAEGAMGPGPDYQGPKSEVFPTAVQVEGEGLGPAAKRVGFMAMDAMGYPARKLAETRGMDASDPNAYLLRPEVEANRLEDGPEQAQQRADYQKIRMEAMEKSGTAIPDFSGGADPTTVNGLTELAGQMASDPVTYAPLIGPLLSAFPKLASIFGKGAGFLNKQTGQLAEGLSGVPEETLRAYGNPAQRAKIHANLGKEKEIGDELLHNIENADDFIPERKVVDEALDKMGPIDLGSAVRSLEGAKGPAVAGRLSPEKGAANAGIQKYIDFLRGGPLPEDLAQGAQDARRAAGETGVEAVAASAQAGQDARAAAQATRAQASAQSKAGKAAAGVGKAKKDAQEAFYSWDRRDTKAAIPPAVREAQDAAAKAREAATTARSRQALGEVSQGEADAAQRAADAAQVHAEVMGAAARLKGGESRKAIADALAAQGMDKDGIRDILKAAIQKAEDVKDLPSQTVTAREYRDLRRDLDVPVNWEQEGAGIKNSALKAGRTTMKNELLAKARESGNHEYAKAMEAWSDKLDKLDGIKDLLGKTGSTRDRRVEQFINNLFGKNSEHKQQLMRDLDEIFQSDITGRAQAAQQASELGPKGRPAVMPQQATGAALKGFALANLVPVLGQAAAFSTASPLIASRFTLPRLTQLEQSLKAAGIKMTPKAQKAMEALRKPTSEAQKIRLASILAAELEASMPSNVIPFQIRRAAEADDQEAPRIQKLRAALDRAKDETTRQKIQAELDKLLGVSMKGN